MQCSFGNSRSTAVGQLYHGRSEDYKRNPAVAHYDYCNAYRKAHHDWMTRMHRLRRTPENAVQMVEELISGRKTNLEETSSKTNTHNRWNDIRSGFLQGDSSSPVEIPAASF